MIWTLSWKHEQLWGENFSCNTAGGSQFLTNFHNPDQIAQFWPIFTLITKFHNSDQNSQFWSVWWVWSNPLHIVWRYIVMQLSYHFQNIVKISLSHFFWTISHDIFLISTHTESPYWWIKVPIGEAIFRWKWHKKSKYTPHKWSLTEKDKFLK